MRRPSPATPAPAHQPPRAALGPAIALPFAFTLALLALPGIPSLAHSPGLPSVHDTTAGVIARIAREAGGREIRRLDATRAEQWLTPGDREVLATGHLSFHADQPVRVSVFHDRSLAPRPFWIRDGGWSRREPDFQAAGVRFEIWERDFPAGNIGLGVPSLSGGGRHYLVAVQPSQPNPPAHPDGVTLTDLYPGTLRTNTLTPDTPLWADRSETLGTVPPGFENATLIQTLHSRRDDGRLVGRLRWTQHRAGRTPDHVTLTWSDDPRTTQTIQWRTASSVPRGSVIFARAEDVPPGASASHPAWQRVEATTFPLHSPSTVNNPVVHRHTARLTGLQPGTRYAYRVGTGSGFRASETRTFVTAPAAPQPFAFVYMGDAQNGLDAWGRLVRGARRERPDAAFYLMAGDLVNRGAERDDWDEFFENARGVFDHRPIVPVIGNHECQGGHPTLYLRHFALPANGPAGIEPGRAYSFEYGNALFVVLDSNLDPKSQLPWLEEVLSRSKARWKIVAYHHPAYSSAPNRDNKQIRELWGAVFDRHAVDLALQGHDHAYLRTHPLRAGQPVASTADGTTYIVSVSGTKLYKQDASQPTTAIGFTDIPTWQVLDLAIEGDRLTYRAYDRAGRIRDTFVIDKGARSDP